jgi:hypothetical protein
MEDSGWWMNLGTRTSYDVGGLGYRGVDDVGYLSTIPPTAFTTASTSPAAVAQHPTYPVCFFDIMVSARTITLQKPTESPEHYRHRR